MIHVADASVIVKWIIPGPREPDSPRALDLLDAVRTGRVELIEPPHWLAEVAGVIVRLRAAASPGAIALLHALELPIADDLEVHATAVALSRDLDHHLFDTLYHAVALHRPPATLVTADEVYFRKARRNGSIERLQTFEAASG